MKAFYALLLACTLLSCKKSSTSSGSNTNQIKNSITGSFNFNFGVAAKNGNTIECVLLENDSVFQIAGQSTDGYPTNPNPSYSFGADIKMPSNNITVGTYSSSVGSNYFTYTDSHYSSPVSADIPYMASSQYPKGTVSFIIDSFNTTTNRVYCHFSGTLQNEYDLSDTTTYTIFNGVVNGVVQFYKP